MATRVLFQLALFVLPFLLFAIYRVALAEARSEGRKPWPIRVLFGIGLVLAIGSWIAFIILDKVRPEMCGGESYLDRATGEVMKTEQYPCERDLSQAGIPRSDDPGSAAQGVGTVSPTDDE